MKSLGEVEESLAEKAEPVLGFKPSSKFKRGPIGTLIYVVCGIIAFFSLRSAGVFKAYPQGFVQNTHVNDFCKYKGLPSAYSCLGLYMAHCEPIDSIILSARG